MEKAYIEDLKVICSFGGNEISHQRLDRLKAKYGLTDSEAEEMREYCRTHGISVFNAEECKVWDKIVDKPDPWQTAEGKRRRARIKIITDYMQHVYTVVENASRVEKPRKLGSNRGVTCNHGRSHLFETIPKIIFRNYDDDTIEYIIAHLPEENDTDTRLVMTDPDNPELCERLNEELNRMMPSNYIYRPTDD